MGPSRNDRALAALRFAVGVLFLIFGEYKLALPEFVHGGFRGWIERFIAGGSYPFMLPVLRGVVLPHAQAWGWCVALGEAAIGLALVVGVAVRAASIGGLLLMLALLFSADYPGPARPLWQYFGASLSHSTLALCFLTFLAGDATRALSLGGRWRRSATLDR